MQRSITCNSPPINGKPLGMDQQAAAAWRKIVAHDARCGGTVRIATVDELAIRILPPIIRSFQGRNTRALP